MYLIEILILLLVLFLSAFFSGSEIALISLSRVKIQQMLQEKRKGSQTIKKNKKKSPQIINKYCNCKQHCKYIWCIFCNSNSNKIIWKLWYRNCNWNHDFLNSYFWRNNSQNFCKKT